MKNLSSSLSLLGLLRTNLIKSLNVSGGLHILKVFAGRARVLSTPKWDKYQPPLLTC